MWKRDYESVVEAERRAQSRELLMMVHTTRTENRASKWGNCPGTVVQMALVVIAALTAG